MPDKSKPKFFYGYIVVAVGFIVSVFLVGSFNSFGIFFKPLSSEFSWPRAETSVATSLAALVMGFSGAIATGRLTDKYGPKVVVIACGLLIGLGTLLMSQVHALWQLYLFYGLAGSGMSAADIPMTATVVRWFIKRRGMMIGITKTGAGVGIVVVPLLANWLISDYGWRNAYTVIGIITLIGIIPIALLFKRDPSRTGELPDGVSEVDTTELNTDTPPFSVKEAMATRQFWIFSAAWVTFMFCMQAIMLHIVPHATDVGISATIAATFISVIGGFSIFGRLGIPSLSDIVGTKIAYLISFSFLIAALIWVQFAREAWMFYLFAALYGTAHGGSFGLLSPMVAKLFGLQSLGSILGIILFAGTFGSLVSPVLAGWIFDIMGSYQLVFIILVVFAVIGLILISLLRPLNSRGGTNES